MFDEECFRSDYIEIGIKMVCSVLYMSANVRYLMMECGSGEKAGEERMMETKMVSEVHRVQRCGQFEETSKLVQVYE